MPAVVNSTLGSPAGTSEAGGGDEMAVGLEELAEGPPDLRR